jgi:hypothetical protein
MSIDAFADAGADIIRLWSDWLGPGQPASAGLIATVRGRGRKLWIMAGRWVPREGDGLQAFHRTLACEPVDAVMTDHADILLAIEQDKRAGKLSCPATTPAPGAALAGKR